ncbi:hypothetical protein CK203_006460 [Vitis vinifera]|uniref:Uncharacterized protein n=1 Tax=Vitis vinifera TaxID=29760 RepID=A0A438KBD4_VITVI|nr:hypothetical protein CK203_006460 [Vitis vinifera]
MGSRCGGTFCTMGAIIGSGRGARVVATGGLDLPGSCGPSLARIELDNCDFLSRCLFAENEWNLSFPHGELEAWVCVAHGALRCMLLGQLLLTQDILILALALSLPPGLLNADDEEDLMLRLECVTQRFLPLTSPSPGGELLAVFRSPTVFFRWLDAIRDYLLLSTR